MNRETGSSVWPVSTTQALLNRWHAIVLSHDQRRPEIKLQEEVTEFLEAKGRDRKLQEGADVIIVVLTQLSRDHWTLIEVLNEVARKLKVNIGRKWAVDSTGVLSHIKEPGQE